MSQNSTILIYLKWFSFFRLYRWVLSQIQNWDLKYVSANLCNILSLLLFYMLWYNLCLVGLRLKYKQKSICLLLKSFYLWSYTYIKYSMFSTLTMYLHKDSEFPKLSLDSWAFQPLYFVLPLFFPTHRSIRSQKGTLVHTYGCHRPHCLFKLHFPQVVIVGSPQASS